MDMADTGGVALMYVTRFCSLAGIYIASNDAVNEVFELGGI